MENPNCYKCKHRKKISGDAHSTCKKTNAKIKGDPHGVEKGWFCWPFNFDPIWLLSCDSFEEK